MTVEVCDVLVVGAGPAGCATALALVGDCSVTMVERPLTRAFSVGESAAPDTRRLLDQLGAAQAIDWRVHRPYHGNLSLWGGETARREPFMLRGIAHGWHLDRTMFDQQLRACVQARGVAIHACGGIDTLRPHRGGWCLGLRDGRELHARIVIDAAGRRAPLATRFGGRRRQLDKLVALVVHAGASADLAGYSLVESCELGWWYALELPDGRTLVALMTDADLARTHGLHAFDAYAASWRATRMLRQHVPLPHAPLQVHAFAAHSGCVDRAGGAGWLAVGDALMALDPLTSSGIAGALRDGLNAAPVVRDMLDGRSESARDYAALADTAFRRFVAERQHHYASELRWTDRAFWSRRRV
ncbi:NAD(P)/FAD-dependent oxidoreductase [Paraburkholderia bannensis]|uniref:NAD(P)/FAD-dependent oxidoreductase n=1 Tax=Paraburkholderia bannensis TaxID=765414 RepID=UPI002AB79C88|nr:tryptophan 7-halogenase [Paraburkholderia bannensis]